MNKKKIILVGCSPNNIEYLDILKKLNYTITAIVDDRAIEILKPKNIKIINFKELLSYYDNHFFFIALGDNYERYKYVKKIKKIFPDAVFPSVYHPSSTIPENIMIGEGNVVGAYTYIGQNCQLKDFNVISPHSCINHDCKLNSFNFLGTRVTFLGGTAVGLYNSIYSHSIISRKVKIASNAIIGTNSYVKSDIGSNSLNYGSPAIFIRKLKKNETLISSK